MNKIECTKQLVEVRASDEVILHTCESMLDNIGSIVFICLMMVGTLYMVYQMYES